MRALISVSNKKGIVEFASELKKLGWELIATGGTMKLLRDNKIEVTNISDITGFPEICEGRVKTLHPNIHGGLLARRDSESHIKEIANNNIEFIDMVCVNLYPFSETIEKEGVTLEEAIENIDIGGPSMLRSAAKNYKSVSVVSSPDDYSQVLNEIREFGDTTPETRLKLSAKAFSHTAQYDMKIATFMREKAKINPKLFLEYDVVQTLRYGENPHQKAKFYRQPQHTPFSLAFANQLHGKELSYNNIQDANAALCIVSEFDMPFCVGVKHMNPCGAAIGKDIVDCWTKTYNADKVSIFGGIVATNQEITEEVAEMIKPVFLEIVIAPKFSKKALEILCSKKNLRLIEVDMTKKTDNSQYQLVSVAGGLLRQEIDTKTETVGIQMVVTQKKPTEEQLRDMNFGMKIVKHIKSNAIAIVKDGVTAGVGAGQTNRIQSAEIALKQANANGYTSNLVLASDAFFPFDDCVDLAAKMGVVAIVQPGGSVRDNESIQKADEKGISMLFTGTRHFKH